MVGSPGIKNGANRCILSVQKYVIINLKINNFKYNKLAPPPIIRHVFSPITIHMCIFTGACIMIFERKI